MSRSAETSLFPGCSESRKGTLTAGTVPGTDQKVLFRLAFCTLAVLICSAALGEMMKNSPG